MTDDLGIDRAMQWFVRSVTVVLLAAITIGLYACPDDSSIDDCSKRGKPQIYDTQRKEWSCRD